MVLSRDGAWQPFGLCRIVPDTAVLLYNGKVYDFSNETLNIIYRDKGLLPIADGLIALVSAWNAHNGEYYATGVTIEQPNNGIVVKTTDFVTMEPVDAVSFNDMDMAEIASYVYKDRLYVACRQNYGIPYLYLSYLDLKTMEWKVCNLSFSCEGEP